MACPFGAITPDFAEGVIVKCDLCPEQDVPACVAGCPNKALLFTDDSKEAERDLVAVGTEESMQEGW
jgi:carbon-monoxide dehydrogenase iron sulfur subunit